MAEMALHPLCMLHQLGMPLSKTCNSYGLHYQEKTTHQAFRASCLCAYWCCRPAELRQGMPSVLAKLALGQAQAVTAHRAQVKGTSPAVLASLYCGAAGGSGSSTQDYLTSEHHAC